MVTRMPGSRMILHGPDVCYPVPSNPFTAESESRPRHNITNTLTMKFQILALSAYLSLAAALTTIRGNIAPSQILPNPSALPADTTITLTTSGVQRSALLRADNTFVFRNVSEGSYLLDTLCSTHHFAPLRVDVARDGKVAVAQTFRGNPWSNIGERREVPIVRFFPASFSLRATR
jgi:hypothetical protein